MSTYKVIKAFDDLRDAIPVSGGNFYHHYEIGDAYPRDGLEPDADRIAELAGPDNAQGTPLTLIMSDAVAEATQALEAAKKEADGHV